MVPAVVAAVGALFHWQCPGAAGMAEQSHLQSAVFQTGVLHPVGIDPP